MKVKTIENCQAVFIRDRLKTVMGSSRYLLEVLLLANVTSVHSYK